jgi:hypothetical protein
MRTALLLLALLTTPVLASQTVWKWVDEQGVTHFSDRPVPGATKVEISSSNRADPQTVSSGSTYSAPAPPASPQYRDFEIWKPAEGETFTNTSGAVNVSIRLNPQLDAGHTLALYLDGRLVEGSPENATEYSLAGVPRGEHTVVARIMDTNGQQVTTSGTVRFTVRQESTAQPPVGPALKPPPKRRTSGLSNKLPVTQPGFGDLNGQRAKIDPRTNAPKKS